MAATAAGLGAAKPSRYPVCCVRASKQGKCSKKTSTSARFVFSVVLCSFSFFPFPFFSFLPFFLLVFALLVHLLIQLLVMRARACRLLWSTCKARRAKSTKARQQSITEEGGKQVKPLDSKLGCHKQRGICACAQCGHRWRTQNMRGEKGPVEVGEERMEERG